MKFYVYCVAESRPSLEGISVGIAESDLELLEIEGLVAVASKFEDESVQINRVNVLRHEAIVRSVLTETTLLPFRFGTVVGEANLRSFLIARRTALLSRLALVRNCIEMSIKIIWQIPSELTVTQNHERDVEVGVGAAFLLSKRQEILGDESLLVKANEIASWLHSRLDGLVRQEQIAVEPKQKLVLAGSYLIEQSLDSKYRELVAKLKEERPHLHFLTSGPWPPYTFANIDLEFATHFGVS
ncbi:MAG TPA: GvpL/GvpF family gas vesicle protein [Pyrinomonadaceae bacterium]|jgi:hypothetical protein|nr:GvpL/GvpF family gas vesicle protein [Pyrinomonadaceae bacterium]